LHSLAALRRSLAPQVTCSPTCPRS
jgi:hypothetical protein